MIADITISHGHSVDEMAAVNGSGQPGWCEFCAITSYRLVKTAAQDVEVTMILASNDDHVTSKVH